MRSFKKYILESDTKEGYYKHSIWLSRSYLRELPDFLSGITIGGGFDVSNNQLTSCKNFPMYIAGSIAISSNNIESLEGLPLELNSTLLAQHNKLKDLKGFPQKVYGLRYLNFDYNKLESLEGIPENLSTLDFSVESNNLKNLIGAPKKIYGSLFILNNPLTSLAGLPEYVENNIYISKNSGFSEDEIRDICHGQYVKSAAINTIKGLCDYALDDIIAKAYRMRE